MPDSTHSDGASSGQDVPDGQMDFASFSDVQLQQLLLILDRERYPLNAQHLQAELNRRTAQPSQSHEPAEAPARADREAYPVRFTERDGWRGWFNAKRRRQPFFSTGTIALHAEEVVLDGWCRSWLGVSEPGEWRIATHSICNVAANGREVSFDCRRPWRLRRRLLLKCESAEIAARIASALPQRFTSGFERKWQVLQDFTHRLDAQGVRPWITPVLVALNVLVFALIVIVNRAWVGVSWQTYINWGANYGPLTTEGQWWRLLTSLFLHGGLWHLLANMWVLWNAGRLTERLYGNGRYALIWFGSGLAATMTSVVWNPTTVSIGASGAIFGVLGAFLAHAIKPSTRLPMRILAVHWISTAVFALFSLINGWFDQGIDNAAHLGGLLMGLVLGFLLAQPLPAAFATAIPLTASGAELPKSGGVRWVPIAISTLCAAAYLCLGYVLARGVGTHLTAPTSYLNAHRAFVTGEERNLRRWNEIGQNFGAGQISPAELSREFQADVLPFWVQTEAATVAELPKLPQDQQLYAKDVLAYVKERHDWVNDLIQEAAAGTGAVSADVMQTHLTHVTDLLARMERRRMVADAGLAPRAFAQSHIATQVSQLFRRTPPCVEPPAWTGRTVGTQDNPEDGPAHRHSIQCSAQRAFLAQDFSALEMLWHRYPADDTDPIDGVTRHGSAIAGLNDLFEYGQVRLTDALAALANWRKQYPQSVIPDLVEASLFQDWAWSARGTGFAKDTAQQQWQLFHVRSVMASAALDDAQTRGATDPVWYALRLSLALDLSEDRDAQTRLFDSAIARYPNYVPLLTTRLRILMPRWGGSYDDVENLINWAARRPGTQGTTLLLTRQGASEEPMYARLYSSYASLEGDETDFYTAGKMRWPEVQEGFDELLEQFPHSDALLNDYAYLACREGDSAVYRLLRKRVEGHVASGAWTGEYTLARCDKLIH